MILDKIVALSSPSTEGQIRNAWHELPSGCNDDERLIQVLEILLQAGADINSEDPLTKITLLQRLLDFGPDLESSAEFLLSKGANVNCALESKLKGPLFRGLSKSAHTRW